MSDEMIMLPLESYESLMKDSKKLTALEAAGVDNWEGYGEAMDILREEVE